MRVVDATWQIGVDDGLDDSAVGSGSGQSAAEGLKVQMCMFVCGMRIVILQHKRYCQCVIIYFY